jgi:hypothetical protein
VKEDPKGIPLVVDDPSHEMLQNIGDQVPPVTGFVLTTRKENPLVEVLVRAKDLDEQNSTILAGWRYGAGKTVAFTSDAGRRWANDWTGWENYDKFFSQMIRYAMRPVNEEGKFTVASDIKDGQVRVVVTALDKDDEFLNFLNMSGVGTGPEMSSIDIQFRQEAPGRYIAEFPADNAGSYLLAINTGQANAPPLLTGVTVPYSAEFRDREANVGLLTTLASMRADRPRDRRARRDRPRRFDLSVCRRPLPAGGRARAWARRCWCGRWPRPWTWTSPHPVHARPDARRHPGHQHGLEDAGRRRRVRVPARADLHADLPGGRDQPRHAQDAVGPAGNDAGRHVTVAGTCGTS